MERAFIRHRIRACHRARAWAAQQINCSISTVGVNELLQQPVQQARRSSVHHPAIKNSSNNGGSAEAEPSPSRKRRLRSNGRTRLSSSGFMQENQKDLKALEAFDPVSRLWVHPQLAGEAVGRPCRRSRQSRAHSTTNHRIQYRIGEGLNRFGDTCTVNSTACRRWRTRSLSGG